MSRFWIYAFIVNLSIVAACSDDVAGAHDEQNQSGRTHVIENPKDSLSSEAPSSSYSRSSKTTLYFSNKVEIKKSSSSTAPSSSSKTQKSSSSSKPVAKSSSSEVLSSSSEQPENSSSSTPKSSASLRFYDCDTYNCVTMDYLNPNVSYGEFLDKRDNQVYRTIVISNHVWTAQNMNFNADTATPASWCYGNNPQNCDKYGRLYTWEAAQKVCPDGWHLPLAEEWLELLGDHACKEEVSDDGTLVFYCSGNKLMSSGTWKESKNENALGFSIIAAGLNLDKNFLGIGEASIFWSATDTLSLYAYAAMLQNNKDYALFGATTKEYGLSVRCIKGKVE